MASSSSPTYAPPMSSLSHQLSAGGQGSLLNHRASAATVSTVTSGSSIAVPAQPSSREAWKALFTTRIATLVYLKSVLSGRAPHASLVLLSQRDLHAVYDSDRMRKRSHRHLLLGLALSPLVEMPNPNMADFAKGVLNAFAEVDALPENFGAVPISGGSSASTSGPMASLGFGSLSRGEGRGMRNLFSSKKISKKGTFSDLYPPSEGPFSSTGGPSSSIQGHHAGSLLPGSSEGIPSGVLPFSPDFMQVFFTLADVLIEVYSKLILIVGRELRAPPSVSIRSRQQAQQQHSQQASISSIQPVGSSMSSDTHSTSPPSISVPSFPGISEQPEDSLFSPPMPTVPPGAMDIVAKVDAKIKKIIVQVTKELDTVSRHIIKDELTHLESGSTGGASSTTAHPSTSRDSMHTTSSSNPVPHTPSSAAGPISPWTGLPQPPSSATASTSINGAPPPPPSQPRQHKQPHSASSASSFVAAGAASGGAGMPSSSASGR